MGERGVRGPHVCCDLGEPGVGGAWKCGRGDAGGGGGTGTDTGTVASDMLYN